MAGEITRPRQAQVNGQGQAIAPDDWPAVNGQAAAALPALKQAKFAFEQAAAAGLAAVATLRGPRTKGQLRAGQKVLMKKPLIQSNQRLSRSGPGQP